MRILDERDVASLLTPSLALEAMADLFSMDSGAIGYGRLDLSHPAGWLRTLPAFITSVGVFGLKTIHRTDGVGMRYTIYVHHMATGELTGLVDGLAVTNLRTGAVSALATDHLAVPEVAVAALIGTGPVARGQLEVLDLVRPAREVRIYSPTAENRRRFVEEMAGSVSSPLVEADSLDTALDGAQLVTLATKATAPVLFGRHLRPGMHVNSVGPASRDRVEVDPAAFSLFDRVVCDSVDLVMDEAGDARLAVAAEFDRGRAFDLAALVAGIAPSRAAAGEITLFKSVGTGLQDLMVAARLLQTAEETGVGVVVDDFVSVKPVPG